MNFNERGEKKSQDFSKHFDKWSAWKSHNVYWIHLDSLKVFVKYLAIDIYIYIFFSWTCLSLNIVQLIQIFTR